MERQGLYTHFSACCGARQGRLYSLVLEGERGEAPLGVPEWQDGCFVLKRTLANHAWSGIGVVQRASLYVRGAAESGSAAPEEVVEEGWILLRHPEYFFRTLSPQLSGVPDCYWKPEGGGRSLAVPIEDGHPFLLPRYFCFARIERLWGKAYAVFTFDEAGQPVLPEESKRLPKENTDENRADR